MRRRSSPTTPRVLRVGAAALAATIAVGCTGGHPPGGVASDAPPPRPMTIAALGDSITRAFAACGRGGDCAEMSWATGTAHNLDSHRQRLGIDEAASSHNVAVSGARVADLASQVQAAVRARPDYVTVLIGANDACARHEGAMTRVKQFARAFDGAIQALARGLPEARILVLSIPDLSRLWEVGKDRPDVRRVWESHGICQSMLANPTDTSTAARARRDRVRARIQAYNAAMAAACVRHPAQCRHDANAVFDYRFDLDHVSTIDYWHPSRRGQATLAQVAWKAGFWPGGVSATD